VLASGDDIDRLATDGEEADVAALSGWRREVFGEQALKLIRGDIALKFEKRRLTVFEVER
jgi:ribonuclease D